MIFTIPGGIVPDNVGMWGFFGLAQNLNTYSDNSSAQASSTATTFTVPAAAIKAGIIFRTGSAGGGVADTTDTAVNILTAFGNTVPVNGTFQKIVRWLNATGQTITVGGGTGVTVSGTATVSDGSYRDFLLTVTSATAITLTNIGGGTV